jgi:predicted Zn-dependent peptidase
VGNEELQVVKNYMIGSFAGSLTTPFEISDRYKVILSENLPLDYYNNYVERINSVSTTDILEMASKYLSIDSMTTVLVGGK